MFPMQTIVSVFVIGIAYLIIRNLNGTRVVNDSRTMRRKASLLNTKIYLAPYNDIWRNLKLSNKYCSIRLGSDGSSIIARDANSSVRSFKVVRSMIHSREDLWNMICNSFDHNTTFDGLIQLCKTFQVEIDISQSSVENYNNQKDKKASSNVVPKSDIVQTDLPKEKLDVNNASEVELTALPGVSIVMAKKLIKKREEISGFKSVDDVCMFLHLKPHMQNQLKMLICVNKMKGSAKIKRNTERSIDL